MDNFSWLPILIAIIVALSSANKKLQGKPGAKPLNPPASLWPRGFEIQGLDLRRWLSPGERENGVHDFEEAPVEEYIETEGTASSEGTPGIEGTAGDEGSSGTEGTFGTKGPSRQEIETNPSLQAKQANGLFLDTLPTDEDLIRAVVWAEILGKPKALRAR